MERCAFAAAATDTHSDHENRHWVEAAIARVPSAVACEVHPSFLFLHYQYESLDVIFTCRFLALTVTTKSLKDYGNMILILRNQEVSDKRYGYHSCPKEHHSFPSSLFHNQARRREMLWGMSGLGNRMVLCSLTASCTGQCANYT